MSILTGRELEFLAGLRRGWRTLYRNELARLLKEHDQPHRRPTTLAMNYWSDFPMLRIFVLIAAQTLMETWPLLTFHKPRPWYVPTMICVSNCFRGGYKTLSQGGCGSKDCETPIVGPMPVVRIQRLCR